MHNFPHLKYNVFKVCFNFLGFFFFFFNKENVRLEIEGKNINGVTLFVGVMGIQCNASKHTWSRSLNHNHQHPPPHLLSHPFPYPKPTMFAPFSYF